MHLDTLYQPGDGTKPLVRYELGQPYPDENVPDHDFSIASIQSRGITYISQQNRMSHRERQNLLSHFKARAWSLEQDGVLVCGLVTKLGDLPWCDANLDATKQQEEAQGLLVGEDWNILNYYYLDRKIIRKLGVYGLTGADVQVLKVAFQVQLQARYSQAQYTAALNKVYSNFTSDDLVRLALFN